MKQYHLVNHLSSTLRNREVVGMGIYACLYFKYEELSIDEDGVTCTTGSVV